MADETIKYSKNGTTDVFENFEPWRYGEPAIPAELYFLGAGGNGYQQYFDTNSYGVQEINTVDFKINDKPIRGCKKGTVVTAHELARGQDDTEIWIEDGTVRYKGPDGWYRQLDTKGVKLTRLGIALVGGGGACGDCKKVEWKNSCHTFDTTMPGGGGGGGGIIWGIIDLDKADKNKENKAYVIKVGKGGGSKGVHGHATILSKDDKTLAIAGGGKGGGTGKKSGAVGGAGGTCTSSTDKTYFIKCGQREGEQGGSYSELDVKDENQYIWSSVEANNFEIEFIPGSNKLAAGSDKHDGVGDTIENIAQEAGHVYFAVPGGNSYGKGGYPIGDESLVIPEWGGGGMSWTYNDNDPEHIWATNANIFKAGSTDARCGANGGWILFY